jgi:hypothetical protein
MKLNPLSFSSPAPSAPSLSMTGASTELGLIRQGLVAEYRFNEGSGQILYDYSGNNNHGMLGSTTGSDTNDPTYTREGASFTTDDYIACPNISTINTTITVFYTPQITTATGSGTLFSFTTGATTFGGIMFSAGTSAWEDEVITYFNNGGKTAYRAGTVAAGWHILVTRWNGTKYDLILDGVNLVTSVDGTPALVTDGTAYKIGTRSTPAVYLSGVVAFHAVYNRSITDAEESRNRAYLKSYLLRERGIALA